PRHAAVLARLMEHALGRGAARALAGWLGDARWARGNEVDPVLALLVNHSDEDLRHEAVEVLGWRLRKRGRGGEPLLKGLRHRDPATQLLAAEGLARSGRAEGISVLLSAVEYLDDFDLRRRAVLALGELADRRALDLLLKLVNDPDHILQATAA